MLTGAVALPEIPTVSSRSREFLLFWLEEYKEVFLKSRCVFKNPHESSLLFYLANSVEKGSSRALSSFRRPDFEQQIDWIALSGNPSYTAMTYLLDFHADKINWPNLLRNPNYMSMQAIMQEYVTSIIPRSSCGYSPSLSSLSSSSKIDLFYLVENPNESVLPILYDNMRHINMSWFSKSPHSCLVDILEEHPSEIDWLAISRNSCDSAVKLLYKHTDKIDTNLLNENVHDDAVRMLLYNQKLIVWSLFSSNSNNIAARFLAQNPCKVDLKGIAKNGHPEAIDLIRQKRELIDMSLLAENPGIFF